MDTGGAGRSLGVGGGLLGLETGVEDIDGGVGGIGILLCDFVGGCPIGLEDLFTSSPITLSSSLFEFISARKGRAPCDGVGAGALELELVECGMFGIGGGAGGTDGDDLGACDVGKGGAGGAGAAGGADGGADGGACAFGIGGALDADG